MKVVKISEGFVELPTYKMGDADKEAPLEKEFTPRSSPIYPYTTQEIITGEKEVKKYRGVFLENDYLKLTFLPEIGGRLYSAYDKVNDSEIFYSNPVIKPGLFALRGAWPAVGVEFNFPNSHTTTTLEEVSCRTREYDDGSASVTMGDIEWTCRMGWSVEVKLHPAKAVIEMESKLYNPTELPQRFYYWINAACPVYSDTQFIYPRSTKRLYTHPPMDASRLGYVNYPIHEGSDISCFKNIKQHFPVFAEKMEEDFYGIYHHEHARGLVHVANRSLVRGRKLWMFGNARDGKIFIDLLSDEGADYCELQTGPFSLQSDYRMLEPGRIHIQKDFWFPVANTGGFNLACEDFAAMIKVEKNIADISFYAAAPLDGIKIVAVNGGTPGDSKVFSARTGECVKLELPVSDNTDIHFLDVRGNIIAEFVRKSTVDTAFETAENHVVESVYLKGKYNEEHGHRAEALNIYKNDEAKNFNSKLSEARLLIDCGLYDDALEKLETILQSDRNNPEALIYCGRIHRRKENIKKADIIFSHAMDSNLFRDAAALEIAIDGVWVKDYKRAAFILEEILKYGARNPRAMALYALCKRKLKEKNQSHIKESDNLFHLTPLLLGEKFFSGMSASSDFNVNPELMLETACEYINIHEYEDASELIAAQKEIDRQGYYFLAWLKRENGNKPGARESMDVSQKTQWTSRLAFRNETENVLRFAIEEYPDDSTAAYQLGCLLAYKDRWNEAVLLWEKVKGPEEVYALRNIGLYYWKRKAELSNAIKFYKKAVNSPNVGSRTLMEAGILLEEADRNSEWLDVFEEKDNMIKKDSRLKLSMVKAFLANDMPEKAYSLLINGNFCLCEGKMLSRALYETACDKLALNALNNNEFKSAAEFYLEATKYPENIGIGKPSGNKEAEWYLKAGNAYGKAMLPEKALDAYRKGAEKGDFLDIDFFPLRNMIWEADWEHIDVRYWKNLIYRAGCLQYIKEKASADKVFSRVEEYLKFLDKNGRGNDSETIILLSEKNMIRKV
ncbi:MAG: hypothetical protein A2020_07480 [Lentisphaerae bacterium GWF2_45_14]|nr:MAG: hypothetical protein A2020_07480 [Lentisphaerae bacterium GWF2_45_14]